MKKIKEFLSHLKKVWDLPDKQEQQYRQILRFINTLDNKIGERTTIHADIGYKGTGCQIIVVGNYRGRDYVRSFNVRMESLESLINILKTEERGAAVGKFDMIGSMEFSAVYDRERFE